MSRAGPKVWGSELEILLDASEKLIETLKTQEVLQTAVDRITTLVGLESAAVYLLVGDTLRLDATFPALPPDFPEHLRSAPLAEHYHIVESIAAKTPLLVEDLPRDALTDAEREVAEQRNLRTVLYVPMIVEHEAIGVFIVGSVGKCVVITEERISLARALASLSALAVRNAKLYERVESRSRELQEALTERIRVERERKELQEQLHQAQKIESIGRLAGGVAHDFNNMLNVIFGYTELAMETLTPADEAHGHLKEVYRAARHAAEVTRQLLAFARKQSIAPRSLDLNVALGGMLKMLGRLVGENLEIAWRPAEGPLPVLIDPTQLDQILVNLAVNARDAIAGTGSIVIETSEVRIDEAESMRHPEAAPGFYCRLSVKDDGRGISTDALGKIFEPFYTDKERGTGLGLATVYGIVKQNGGFIVVESEEEKGSTFHIHLPRHERAEKREPFPEGDAVAAAGGETVLVIEDDLSILNLIKINLESKGYRVIASSLPEKGIESAQCFGGPIDLLLTDIIMPGINGMEVARRIKALYPQIKIVFMSGYAADAFENQPPAEPGVHYLDKPFSTQELARQIRKALDD